MTIIKLVLYYTRVFDSLDEAIWIACLFFPVYSINGTTHFTLCITWYSISIWILGCFSMSVIGWKRIV